MRERGENGKLSNFFIFVCIVQIYVSKWIRFGCKKVESHSSFFFISKNDHSPKVKTTLVVRTYMEVTDCQMKRRKDLMVKYVKKRGVQILFRTSQSLDQNVYWVFSLVWSSLENLEEYYTPV